MIKRLLSTCAFVVAVLCLAGCDALDSMQNGLAHSDAVASSLEKSLGEKPFVGFNWNNGSLTAVTVTFSNVPKERSLAEIADVSRTAVLKESSRSPIRS